MNYRDVPDDEVNAYDLTWREQEILDLLTERLTNREIANRLHLAESTVKDYVGKILSKLYVKNRREAVERAKALGLLDQRQKSVIRPRINLPSESTPFVGRRDELVQIARLLKETRLLTLTGQGGIGKTRLALKAAKAEADDFEDGCFFVSLAPIHSVEQLIQTVAETLKFPLATHESPKYQLLRYLKKKQILLVMDNFEHLLEGVGIISEILLAAPEVKILATSREKLSLQSETTLYVGGMGFPSKLESGDPLNYDAVNLFVQSACKICPGFHPSPEEQWQITHICQTVQGMPLAIELAAAWLHILNLDEIDVELKKGIDFLVTEVRDVPERHRSIRAVFDHSWSLLDPDEQVIFRQLSVFKGGFTREAAQQVSGASLQQLSGLVNKSFLSHNPDSGRLEIHELLRQYAQERLEDTPEASISAYEAHAGYYAEFMKQRWEYLKGNRQILALAEVEADIENVRTAWRYYLDQKNVPQLWMFINGFWQLYWIRGWYHSAMGLFAEAVGALRGEEDEPSATLQALAMAYQGFFMAWLGLSEKGYELAKEGVEKLQKLNQPEALVLATPGLSTNAYFLNLDTEYNKALSRMLKTATTLNDKWLLAFSLWAASLSSLPGENFSEGRRLAESSLHLFEEIGNVMDSTLPLIVLGTVALANCEYDAAREYYLRSLEISQEIGFQYSIQFSSKYLGKVALAMGNIVEAENYLLQCLAISEEVGFVRDIINLFFEFARLRVAQENLEQAVELLAVVIKHPASRSSRMLEGPIRDSAKELLGKLEEELPHESYAAALERGRKAELEEIIADLIVVPKQ
jgi:predicted ATPase/DNA-binding CsgD family transcriptional regulator